MRVPYVCRPCLARLQRPSSQRFCAALHTVAAQDPPQVPEWFDHQYGSTARSQKDPAQIEIFGDATKPHSDRAPGQARRIANNLKSRTRTQTPADLRSTVLRLRTNLRRIWPRIATVYGLPKTSALQAADQLERLLSAGQVNIADSYADFEAWKFEYAKTLRHLSVAGAEAPPATDAAGWAVFADGLNPSIDAMKASWDELDQTQRQELWPMMIQSILATNPELLPSFVHATYDAAWSPFYVVEDVARQLALRVKSSSVTERENLVELVAFLLENDKSGQLQLGNDIIGTIVAQASLSEAVGLFYSLNAGVNPMTQHTLLQFASKFAKSNEHKALATEIICSMADIKGFDINSPAASSVCTSLLHLSDNEELPPGPAAPDELFRQLLESGLRPNLLNVTALMRNFCVRGHLDTAWTVFDLLLEYGIEPDEHVYSTLLHASKRDLDFQSIRRVMCSIHSYDTWNPAILNDFLDVIFIESEGQTERRRRQKKGNNAFRHMLHVYFKFFHLEPLQKLCSFPLEDYIVWQGPAPGKSTLITDLAAALLPQPQSKLMQPDTITLSLMLSAAIRGAPKFYKSTQSGVVAMLDQINHFNKLFDSGDATAVAIVEKHGSLIYDVFLRGMLQFQQLLHPAVELVKTMLERASKEEMKFGGNRRYPRPSVHTWTMLVNGFKNHRQPGIAASMVRVMIKEGGIKPNMVTWNTLITAFARVNDAQGAVRAIKYLEQSGLRPDKHTIEAISSMNPEARKKALSLMEDSAEKLIPADDDVAPLLAAPLPRTDTCRDPVSQQQRDQSAPPLSDDEVWAEMQRLTKEGDHLLAEGMESYTEEDFPPSPPPPPPPPVYESTKSFGAVHPRNTSHVIRLVKYKQEVDTFIRRVRARHEGSATAKPLIESDQPVAKPAMPPTQAPQFKRLRRIWNEAYMSRNQLREIDFEERPIGLRPWEEGLQWRLQARAANFKDRPMGVETEVNDAVPLGIVAQRDEAPHPRVSTSRQLNPELRRTLVKERRSRHLQERDKVKHPT
ncbi:hypothetical protein BKA67DRAFT_561839 [Truncatella angustata]|uniref:Pentatricopeptide repeat-containing protein n=1 Tax=Truncatella angustata TaxID=152316 RepID=A0A9P8UP43_9PEZI|nr:uncharacterized protein BKA67DRAFT_561839 [Truncatella angustata]KAH6655773.1 hypothetical protein BKA67DRAFT_561839 [Truncatella angustata]